MADVKISITGGVITVDKNNVKVSKAAKEKVNWQCHDQTFTIESKPGKSPAFTVPATQQGAKLWTAELDLSNEPVGTIIAYSISAPGATTLDPDIEIVP